MWFLFILTSALSEKVSLDRPGIQISPDLGYFGQAGLRVQNGKPSSYEWRVLDVEAHVQETRLKLTRSIEPSHQKPFPRIAVETERCD